MKESLSALPFRIGFLVGLCAFGLMNGLRYQADSGFQIIRHFNPSVLWGMDAYGFPFIYYYEWSATISGSLFAWVEGVADVLIALISSVLIGLIVNFAFST